MSDEFRGLGDDWKNYTGIPPGSHGHVTKYMPETVVCDSTTVRSCLRPIFEAFLRMTWGSNAGMDPSRPESGKWLFSDMESMPTGTFSDF